MGKLIDYCNEMGLYWKLIDGEKTIPAHDIIFKVEQTKMEIYKQLDVEFCNYIIMHPPIMDRIKQIIAELI
jgi:hypothetical protein